MGVRTGTPPPSLDEVRERVGTLPARYRTQAANGFAAELALAVDEVPFRIEIRAGACTVAEGPCAAPTTRIVTDAATWLAIDAGTETAVEAFLDGRVEVRGNVELAMRLQSLFRFSGRRRTPQDLEHLEVPAGGVRFSTFVMGEGPPVVLLHGLAATKLSWSPLLGALAERYRVIAPDLPGHGESSKPRGAYTPAFFARTVLRFLDELGIDRAVLVGNSMGGRVALEVASRAPARVGGLILLDPAVAGLPFPYYSQILRLIPIGAGAIPFPIQRRLVIGRLRQLFGEPDRLPPQAYAAGTDEVIRIYRPGPGRVALLSTIRGMMRDRPDRFWDAVRQIGARTLVLWGDLDRLVPVRFGQVLAGTMPDAELIVLPGVGHVPQFEMPEETAGLVRGFLDELPLG